MADFILESINGDSSQIEILYSLLKKRRHFISHHKLPDFVTHKKFVKNHPYRAWWIIKKSEEILGTAYLTKENAIGINLNNEDCNLHKLVIQNVIDSNYPLPPIPSVRPDFFYINISPSNECLARAVKEIGGILTQSTFKV